MTDGKGGCCIARGRHVADYNSSKMDMIMLKFRPIAPKPTEGTAASAAADGAASHAKATGGGGRGRKKSNSNNKDSNNNSINNNNNSSSGSSHSNRRRRKCNNGRKRKSSSSEEDQQKSNHQNHDEMNDQDDHKADLTLLPLFPEAPDLSASSNNSQVHNNNLLPFFSLNSYGESRNTPGFEGNYNHCHQSWW